MHAPGRPDEDTRGGFRRCGWAQGYADVAALKATTDLTVLGCGELLRDLAGLIDTHLLHGEA